MEGSGQLTLFEGQVWTSPRRGVGRPSLVAHDASLIAQGLREDADPSTVEILRRVCLAGHCGGKNALGELVRQLRAPRWAQASLDGAADVTVLQGSRGASPIREVKRQ